MREYEESLQIPPQRALWPLLWWLGLALLAAAVLLPGSIGALSVRAGDLGEGLDPRAEAQLAWVEAHLARDFEQGYQDHQVVAPEFAIEALAEMASGLMNLHVARTVERERLVPLIEEITARALSPKASPYAKPLGDLVEADQLDAHGHYLGHVNLILGIRRHIVADDRLDVLHTALSIHLRKLSVQPGARGHVKTRPDEELEEELARVVEAAAKGAKQKKSQAPPAEVEEGEAEERQQATAEETEAPGAADDEEELRALVGRELAVQAVVLASLHLYDRTRQADFADTLTKVWFHEIEDHLDEETGLPRPTLLAVVTGQEPWARPRGSALGPLIFYTAQFAPEKAGPWYAAYREHYGHWVGGLGGSREWPAGAGGKMTDRTGLVAGGLGMAATVRGLAAARLMEDRELEAGTHRTVDLLAKPALIDSWGHHLVNVLYEAWLFNGVTVRRRWFEAQPPPQAGFDGRWPAPLVVYGVLAVEALLVLFLLSRAWFPLRGLMGWGRARWRRWREGGGDS